MDHLQGSPFWGVFGVLHSVRRWSSFSEAEFGVPATGQMERTYSTQVRDCNANACDRHHLKVQVRMNNHPKVVRVGSKVRASFKGLASHIAPSDENMCCSRRCAKKEESPSVLGFRVRESFDGFVLS